MKFPFLKRAEKVFAGKGREKLLSVGNETPLFNEEFKSLRAKFEYQVDIHHHKVIAVTSSIAGEGKTLLCAQLARNLALSKRKKVLLIDVDIRKEDLSRGLGIVKIPGLTEHLLGAAAIKDILRPMPYPDLTFIPSGAEVASPADLLAREEFTDLLREMREKYDIILLDTPPVLPVADTVTIRERVDGFVFVFRVAYTPHHLFRAAMEEIGEKRILGVAINAVEQKTPNYYKRYYGRYYIEKESA